VAAYFVANDTTLFSGPELHHLAGRNPFSCRDIDRVFASTMAANTGSRRVLEKLGMTHVVAGV